MHRNSLTIAGLLIVPMLAGLAFADTIPRRVLIADVDHTSVQISPDGMRVGWVFTDTAGRHLFVRELAGSNEREVAPGTEITAWQWSKGSDKLLVVTHGAAGETLSALPLDNPPKTQTLISGSRVRVIGANATDVVASVVTSSADSTGVFRIHLDGSGAEKLADIGDADAWWVDRDMRLIAARIPDGGRVAICDVPRAVVESAPRGAYAVHEFLEDWSADRALQYYTGRHASFYLAGDLWNRPCPPATNVDAVIHFRELMAAPRP